MNEIGFDSDFADNQMKLPYIKNYVLGFHEKKKKNNNNPITEQ